MPRWTPEARRKQAEIQKTRQSWKHSTGPKTAAGKARASMNAWKHGLRTRPAIKLRAAVTRQSRVLKQINAYLSACRKSPLRLCNANDIKKACLPEQDKIRRSKNEQTPRPNIRQNESARCGDL